MKHTLTHFLAAIAVIIAPFNISNAQVAPGPGDVLISEYSALKSSQEFLELYNNTATDITLADCKLIRTVSGGANYVFDFNTEGTGDIIVPANGFLIVSNNSTKTNFNSIWGVDLDALGANYNTGSIYGLYKNSRYKLSYGGTANTDDGTVIDENPNITALNVRVFQAPITYFNQFVTTLLSDYTPGYFECCDDLATWDFKYTIGGLWVPTTPNASSGSLNALVVGSNSVLTTATQLNDLRVKETGSINLSTQTVTVNGDLYLEEGGSVAITNNSGSLNVLGTSTIDVTGSTSSNNFNVWSSPFTNTDIQATFSGANPCDIYAFQASSQLWKYDYAVPYSTTCNGVSVSFTTNNVIPSPEGTPDGMFDTGRGYFAPGTAAGTRTFTSTGSLNNGVITIPVYGTSLAVAGGNDWNLLGNPYVSGIKINSLISGNASINAIYVYNGATGSYTTHSAASTDNLAPGQGFFIDLNTTTDGFVTNFTMTNSLRTSSYSAFEKSQGDGEDTTTAFVSISNTQGMSDQIQVFISPDSEDGIDNAFDARKLMNDNNLNFASLIESDPMFGPEPYVFNGVKSLEDQESKVIDLFVQTDAAGDFEIKIDSLRDMPFGMSIVLEDKVTSAMTNLRTDAYTFTSAVADTLENRFYLHLSYDASVTSIEDIVNVKQVSIYAQNDEINVKVLTNNTEISTIEVYTVLGKQIILRNTKGTSAVLPTANLSSGVYIVKVQDSNGNFYTERVFVK